MKPTGARSARVDKIAKLWYRFSSNKISVVGLVIVILVILSAILAPYITPYPEHSGSYVDFENALKAPDRYFLFGTDQYGRDQLSRIIFAFRGALVMSIGVIGVSAPVGIFLGLLAGYYKNTLIETIIMRSVDIFLSIPSLILALTVASILTPNLFNSLMAVTIGWWAWYARIAYGLSSSARNEYYVKAAQVLGAKTPHIIIKEILPNIAGPLLTKITLDLGLVILIGATLSYVGLGEQPPTPALGTMISDGAAYLPNSWWLVVFPSLAVLIIVLSFNLVGDGIQDMLGKGEV
ncbi:MAG: ABC transporter permease [Saccharofermentanales bacterium]|jgi:peptide/nickel transport system permease protein